MSRILLSAARELSVDQQAMRGMFALRYKVFYERLQWEVGVEDGYERDDFDDLNPTYMVARSGSGVVEGCWRLLPTTGPYMLKDTFPQLARGEAIPEDPVIWEVSRFAIDCCDEGERGVGGVNPLTIDMFLKVVDFAEANGIASYVTVISASFERLLKRIGMPMRRFGDGRAQKVGRVLSVACWIDVNDELRNCLLAARETTRGLPVAA